MIPRRATVATNPEAKLAMFDAQIARILGIAESEIPQFLAEAPRKDSVPEAPRREGPRAL